MGTKSLTITEEPYEQLRAQKRGEKSFTDAILRLTERHDPKDSFGLMNDVDGFEAAVADTRERFDDGMRKRTARGRK